MKYAIPVTRGILSAHFGHCEQFALIDADENSKNILKKEMVAAPPHQPGLLPPWLAKQGVQVVIAGGMGMNAVNIFQQNGINVLLGAPEADPEKVVIDYLNGNLVLGDNRCDH
ncbi:MAG: NifB/NifX family molybdenum-iron cluster-binding protein [Dehalococcoidia bacterium]|nr:NifB/NifX family molybdenum-iron cluster-binding protein [Dehalococcoidia bacterium]